MAIYAAHTNLDNAPGGVNFEMARRLGLQRVEVLKPKEEMLLKLVTYVPRAEAEKVREALFAAGCGTTGGGYDCCSFVAEGMGTFRPGPGTHPYCGRRGELHGEPEVRIETILPAYLQGRIGFYDISDTIAECMQKAEFSGNPDLGTIFETHRASLSLARGIIDRTAAKRTM